LSEQPQIDPNAPVKMGDFQQVLTNLQNTFNDALTKRDQQNEARFNQFAQVLQQVVDKVQTQPQTGIIDKSALTDKLFDRLLAKFGGDEDDPSKDPLFQNYKESVQQFQKMGLKIANQGMANILRREMRNPNIVRDMAANMVTADIEAAGSHGPI
jgi:hypothetical protein